MSLYKKQKEEQMTLYQCLSVSHLEESISLITLNRPEKRNALNLVLMEELSVAIEKIEQEPHNRIAILSAQGNVFCAGLDLHEASDAALAEQTTQAVAKLLTVLFHSPMITIAAIQGDAIAGGAGLVAACDFAIMAKQARIGFPEVRRGLIAAQVATLLCRQMRMREVKELLLLGELIGSERALEIGLINRVAEESELMHEAITLAKKILLGAPKATRETKHLLERLDPSHFSDDLKTAMSFHRNAKQSLEAKEGVAAFLEKRPPNWIDR